MSDKLTQKILDRVYLHTGLKDANKIVKHFDKDEKKEERDEKLIKEIQCKLKRLGVHNGYQG